MQDAHDNLLIGNVSAELLKLKRGEMMKDASSEL